MSFAMAYTRKEKQWLLVSQVKQIALQIVPPFCELH